MKSIPAAMTWELAYRGRWQLPAAALGALAFPTLVFTALRQDGALLADHPSMLIMHFVMVQMNAAMFGSALISNAWNLSRHHAYPVPAATLATWRMAPMMGAMAVQSIAWTAALNVMFPLNWPLWGPAVFSAVGLAAVLAAFWLMNRSRWVFLALAIVGIVLGLWLNARYGGLFSKRLQPWGPLTPTEILTLVALAVLSWRVAVLGVVRSRRGEPPFTLGIIAWVDRLFDRAPAESRRFRSAERAQFWYALRQGWLMPAAVAVILLAGLILWLLFNRNSRDLVDGLWQGSGIMVVVALLGGLAMAGSREDFALREYEAARPMTTTRLAHIRLRAVATSLLAAWAVWAAAVAATYVVLVIARNPPSSFVPPTFGWRQLPVLVLASWGIAAGGASLVLTGRQTLLMRLIIGGVGSFIAFVVVTKIAVEPPMRAKIHLAAVATFGAACLLGTAWTYIACRRRGLISAATAWAAVAAWTALVLAALSLFPRMETSSAGLALASGLLALVVAPLAAAPLALSWNRHR